MVDPDEAESPGQDAADAAGSYALTNEDMQTLVEQVYALIKEELRIECERAGYLKRRFG